MESGIGMADNCKCCVYLILRFDVIWMIFGSWMKMEQKITTTLMSRYIKQTRDQAADLESDRDIIQNVGILPHTTNEIR